VIVSPSEAGAKGLPTKELSRHVSRPSGGPFVPFLWRISLSRPIYAAAMEGWRSDTTVPTTAAS
jgi:hypothetical protein